MTKNPYANTPEAVLAAAASGPPSGASVHTQQTSDRYGCKHSYRRYIADKHLSRLDHIYAVYEYSARQQGHDGRHRLDSCKSRAWFVRNSESGLVRIAANSCLDRWCPICQKTRIYSISQSVLSWLEKTKEPKFITFTLKHSDATLKHQLDSLYDYFRKIRRRKLLARTVAGGFWFFQIVQSKTDGLFHPHIHCLVDSKFIPQRQLSRLWQQITHGSKIVDIRSVRSAKHAADYVARYATQPCNLSDLNIVAACTVVNAMKHLRTCGAWGSARGYPLRPHTPENAESWVKVGSFWQVSISKHSNAYASEIWDCFVNKRPLHESVTLEVEKKSIEDYNRIVERIDYKQLYLDFY